MAIYRGKSGSHSTFPGTALKSIMQQSSLRICHVQPIALDIFGHCDDDWGTKVRYFLPNLATAQLRQGDRPVVHLLTSSKPRVLEVEGVEIHFHRCLQLPRSLPVTNRFGRQISWAMLKAIRADEMDIVHFHGSCSLHLMYGAAALRARRQNLPMVSQDHGPRKGRWIEEKLRRVGFRNTRAVLAANQDSLQKLEGSGVPRESLSVMPNGFDPKVFFPAMGRQRGRGDAFRILVVSRLWPDKDPITMAEGIGAYARRGRKVEVTIIGQGVLRKQVEQLLQEANIPARFIEHTTQPEMCFHYQASDALVLTSMREGWNQATIEAMACGLPVIATDIPGIRDGVDSAGILIPVQRPELLANAIQFLADDPGAAQEYRQRGLRRAQDFTWEAVALQLRDVYRACLAGSVNDSNTAAQAFPVRADFG